ncbi:ras-domain-containing protein [Hyaloscypha hepaticicola]|uniref:Ras-domain-containing protein n=1 Tax=Hyaloscypha hepaticicola TaxID=2082293 RepID=A0A2J6Q354_9HELO|nr:ras-domain-containing protein [Hyaloscypha hepaticicola]
MSSPTPERITITICGDGGCGKSSITLRLVRSQWTSTYDPTIEDSYTLTRRIDGQTYHLSLTDTAGQEEYRGMWASSNLRSDAFLLVYDITNKGSLEVLEEFNGLIDIEAETRMDAWEREQREQMAKSKSKSATRNFGQNVAGPVKPVKIVAGNKCDLQESRQVPAQVGLEWARKRGCGFMETSARNTVNIEETFALIVRRVVEARRRAASGWLEAEAEGEGGVEGGGDRQTQSSMGLGTRRAVTAPLSPLPGGPEKAFEGREKGDGKGTRWKKLLRKLVCWR